MITYETWHTFYSEHLMNTLTLSYLPLLHSRVLPGLFFVTSTFASSYVRCDMLVYLDQCACHIDRCFTEVFTDTHTLLFFLPLSCSL